MVFYIHFIIFCIHTNIFYKFFQDLPNLEDVVEPPGIESVKTAVNFFLAIDKAKLQKLFETNLLKVRKRCTSSQVFSSQSKRCGWKNTALLTLCESSLKCREMQCNGEKALERQQKRLLNAWRHLPGIVGASRSQLFFFALLLLSEAFYGVLWLFLSNKTEQMIKDHFIFE